MNTIKNIWKGFTSSTLRVRLTPEKTAFPFSAARSLGLYIKSIVFFIVGSLLPVALFLLALKIIPADSLFSKLIMADGAEGMILTVLSVSTFVCGFGLQFVCIRRAFHNEGLRMRDVLALNLESLNGSWLRLLLWGVATFALGLACEQLVGLIYTLPAHDPTAEFIKTLGGSALYLMAALAVIGPVMEEIIFRGFLYNMLRKFTSERMNSSLANVVAIFGSAALFGLLHMNLVALPFYMVLGAVYAEAYRRSGSLMVPIVGHVLNNSMIVVALILRS